MGLMDVLNGMQNGPRGARTPAGTGDQPGATATKGGLSPLMMAVLGLIAYKAIRSVTGGGSQPSPAHPSAPPVAPPLAPSRPTGGTVTASMPGASAGGSGGFGDLLKGGLGGLLAGGAAGTVLSGGLNDLLKQMQQGGHGETANSWVGKGPNRPISPTDLGSALGADQINTLVGESGLSRDELLEGLSHFLPQVVDHLTPEGEVPSPQHMQRLI
jgi:uncharacterized protein YidB (DUF937 family)